MLHGVAAPTPEPLKARQSVTAETLTFIMWTARSASRFVAGRGRMPRERIAEHLSERALTAAGIHVSDSSLLYICRFYFGGQYSEEIVDDMSVTAAGENAGQLHTKQAAQLRRWQLRLLCAPATIIQNM